LSQRQEVLGIISNVGHGARIAVDERLFLAHHRLIPDYFAIMTPDFSTKWGG
jgi:hypothetical protein